MKKQRLLSIISLLALLIPLASFAQSDKSMSIKIDNIIVSDRNVGALLGGTAENYTNNRNHADHNNLSFKGGYYTWNEAKTVCPSGWRLPTRDELNVLYKKIQFSNGTVYLASGDGSKCYFPLSGFSGNPSGGHGHYWLSEEYNHNSGAAWHLDITKGSCMVNGIGKDYRLSVRCVKSIDKLADQASDVSVSLRFGNMIISDRNEGTIYGGTARNYTNDSQHIDHYNLSFKGAYYTWHDAINTCPSGWRLPTFEELSIIHDAMQFSGGRVYVADGDGNRCYFPLSGQQNYPFFVFGSYWSSSEDTDNALCLNVSNSTWTEGYGIFQEDLTVARSVRCVQTAP